MKEIGTAFTSDSVCKEDSDFYVIAQNTDCEAQEIGLLQQGRKRAYIYDFNHRGPHAPGKDSSDP